jgi:hypothetical protein
VDTVISDYIRRQGPSREEEQTAEVRITNLTVRGRKGECVRFESGEEAWIDIEVSARKPCHKLSVSLYFSDPEGNVLFNTSLERLGHSSFDLEAGQVFRCTFEIDLNMAAGTFHVSALVFRYDNETEYDRWMHAATIFISSSQDVRGVVNCFPRVIKQEVLEGLAEEAPKEELPAK